MKTIIKTASFAYHIIADFVKAGQKTTFEEFLKETYENGQSKELAKLFSEYDDETISIEDFDEYKMNSYNEYKNLVLELHNRFGDDLKAIENYLFTKYGSLGEIEDKQKKTKMLIIFKEAGFMVQGHAIVTIFKRIMSVVDDLMDCTERYWGNCQVSIDGHQAISFYCNFDTRKVINEVMLEERFNSIVEFKEA